MFNLLDDLPCGVVSQLVTVTPLAAVMVIHSGGFTVGVPLPGFVPGAECQGLRQSVIGRMGDGVTVDAGEEAVTVIAQVGTGTRITDTAHPEIVVVTKANAGIELALVTELCQQCAVVAEVGKFVAVLHFIKLVALLVAVVDVAFREFSAQ